MRRLLIGCAALALLTAPAAAQYYEQGGGYQQPRYQEHYVAPKPRYYEEKRYYKPKPKYEHRETYREHYTPPPSYGGYGPRY